jgi:HSPB1-associated protein 1
MKKEQLNVSSHMAVEQTLHQNLAMGTIKQEATSSFGPDLILITPTSEGPHSERRGIFESNGKEFVHKDGEHFTKLYYARGRQMTSKSEKAMVQQTASKSTTVPPQAFVSTDDLLDCMVNPQVTRMVAQLLIQGKSL